MIPPAGIQYLQLLRIFSRSYSSSSLSLLILVWSLEMMPFFSHGAKCTSAWRILSLTYSPFVRTHYTPGTEDADMRMAIMISGGHHGDASALLSYDANCSSNQGAACLLSLQSREF